MCISNYHKRLLTYKKIVYRNKILATYERHGRVIIIKICVIMQLIPDSFLNKSDLTEILSNFCSNHLPSLQHRYLQKTQLAAPLVHALHYNAPSTAVLKGVILPSLTSQMKKNLQPCHIILSQRLLVPMH